MLDNTLYRRTIDNLLLKCLGLDQSRITMGEVHEGICGTHQLAHKMKWLLCRDGFYWPTMLSDYFRYYKSYESCQKFGDVQLAPTTMLHPIIKPWPFRGCALDFVGQIYSASSKCHWFVLIATNYFTKWTEAVPLKNMTHTEVIQFISEHIIHRFDIPQTLTTDQGLSFMSHQVWGWLVGCASREPGPCSASAACLVSWTLCWAWPGWCKRELRAWLWRCRRIGRMPRARLARCMWAHGANHIVRKKQPANEGTWATNHTPHLA
jgi:hypothetical protein